MQSFAICKGVMYAKVSSVFLCMLLLSEKLHPVVLHVALIMWRTCTCTASSNIGQKVFDYKR